MIDLRSMAVAMPEVAGHPNRAAFRGVLTMVDVPSQRPPSGARGHLVVLTKRAAEAALPSLLGMGVDYSPSLDRHDVRCKVGVITRAEIVGRNVELGGYLFSRDFPEIVKEIANSGRGPDPGSVVSSGDRLLRSYTLHGVASDLQQRLRTEGLGLRASLQAAAKQILNLSETLGQHKKQKRTQDFNTTIRAETYTATPAKGLGMSYEVTDVQLADTRAQVWMLERVTFTGAAILRRDKAAYRDTWIELSG
ncbi:MAG: hypothetical protein WCC99_02475 [Candidatus Sulfotelmatobacter sp.]